MATKYYAEYAATGNTRLLIEDYLYLNKDASVGLSRNGLFGVGKTPVTDLDVDGQIRLTSGLTYYEGELRYTSNKLWINTGGTANDWVPLADNNDVIRITNNGNNRILTATSSSTTINAEFYFGYSPGILTMGSGYEDQLLYMTASKAQVFLWSSGNTSPSILNLAGINRDIDDNENLGEITWAGTKSTVLYETASIHVESSERWASGKYGSNLYIKTTTPAAASAVSRIAIESGDVKIQNGNLYVENNLNVTGTIDNLNNLGRFSSNLIETSSNSYTGLTTDYTIVCTYAGAGNVTIVLPVASSFPGRIINVKSMTNSSLSIKVTNGSGDSIIYASQPPTLGLGDVITVQSNGVHTWYVIGYLNVP